LTGYNVTEIRPIVRCLGRLCVEDVKVWKTVGIHHARQIVEAAADIGFHGDSLL
jgi:hypothetical protein